jgi:predicted transcriptional regulator
MQNRQKEEMIMDILTSVYDGAMISHIMRKAYLSHGQAKLYLGELSKKGLLDVNIHTRQYKITSKGVQYLTAIQYISDMLDITSIKRKALTKPLS